MAEIELAALTKQCLDLRIGDQTTLAREIRSTMNGNAIALPPKSPGASPLIKQEPHWRGITQMLNNHRNNLLVFTVRRRIREFAT